MLNAPIPPIGPMTDKQKRLEVARRQGAEVVLAIDGYVRDLHRIRFPELTPNLWADLQGQADTVAESFRQLAQRLYDQIEAVSSEPDVAALIASLPPPIRSSAPVLAVPPRVER